MSNKQTIGIDIAKRVFYLHGEKASPYIARDLCRFDDAMQYGFGRNHGVFIAFDDKEAGISRKPFGIAGDGRVRPICRRCL